MRELYDHKKDPNESQNRVNEPAYKVVVEKFKKRLDAGWKAALPEGIVNRSDNPPAPEFVPWGPEARFGPYAEKREK